MTHLLEEVRKEGCSLAVKIFIIKVVINKSSIFEKYMTQWFDVLVDYSRLKENGSKYFHYFLRDVCTTLLDWCAKKANLVHKRLPSEKKQNLCQVINKVCRVNINCVFEYKAISFRFWLTKRRRYSSRTYRFWEHWLTFGESVSISMRTSW